MNVSETIEKLKTGKLSAKELTKKYLSTIQKKNPEINALLSVNPELAFELAEHPKEPLFGLPIVISDALHFKGTPTTFGSTILKDNISQDNSLEVERLIQAGAVILGETNLAEFGLSFETANQLRPPCKNPLNPLFSPGGGASAGAAAVASNMAALAVATDISGALRVGASMTGLFGLVPSRGLIPLVRPHLLLFCERMFYRKGIIAKDVFEIALVLSILAKHHPDDPLCFNHLIKDFSPGSKKEVSSLKIAVSKTLGLCPIDPEVEAVFDKTVKKLKAQGHTIIHEEFTISKDTTAHFKSLFASDRLVLISNLLNETKQSQKLLQPKTLEWMRLGQKITGAQYSLANTYVRVLEDKINALFNDVDLLLTPAVPCPPWPLGKPPKKIAGETIDPFVGLWSFLFPFNMSGHPALVFPAGKSNEGLPIGLQWVAQQKNEELLLQMANHLV